MFKSFPKILTIFFLTMFILQMIFLFFLLAAPVASQAIEFTPQVSGLDYKFDAKDTSTGNIARYVRAIYNYGIGIIGILAAVVLMIGGVLWIVAGGNATQIGEAKAYIGASLTGLILALTSYLILSTVNPALVNLQTTDITGVAKYIGGSCLLTEPTAEGKLCIDNTTKENCGKYGQFREGIACPISCCSYNEDRLVWPKELCDVGITIDECGKRSKNQPQMKYSDDGQCVNNGEGGKRCERVKI